MPTHSEKRNLPHTREQMYDLVSDVEKYPEFLPWCIELRVKDKRMNQITADMVIGYKMFQEKFTSKVQLKDPDRIDVVYEDGPFKYLNNRWIFIEEDDGSCTIDFFVDFEFKSKLLQNMIGIVFNEAIKIMVKAFEKRACIVYGNY